MQNLFFIQFSLARRSFFILMNYDITNEILFIEITLEGQEL